MADANTLAIIDAMIKNKQGRVSRKDLARQALYASAGANYYTPPPPGKGSDKRTKGGESAFQKVIDYMSRGVYTSANIAEHLTGHGQESNIVAEALSGLSGKDKKTYADVMKSTGTFKNAAGLGLSGFLLDVALDPTTYIGVGAVGKAARLLGMGKKTKEIDEVAEEAIGHVTNPRPHPGRGEAPDWEGPLALEAGPIGKAEMRAKAKKGEPIQPVKPAYGKQEGVAPLPGMTLKDLKSIRIPAAATTPKILETVGAPKVGEQLAMITRKGDIYQRFQKTPIEQADEALQKVDEIEETVQATKNLPETPAGKVRQDITDVKDAASDAAPVNIPAGKNIEQGTNTAAKNAAEKANKAQNPTPEAVMDAGKVGNIVSQRLRDIEEAGTNISEEVARRHKSYNGPKQGNSFNEAFEQAKRDFVEANPTIKNPGAAKYRAKINADVIRYLREVESKMADAGFPPMGAKTLASSILPLSKVLERVFQTNPRLEPGEFTTVLMDDILNFAKDPSYVPKTLGPLGKQIRNGEFDDLVTDEFQKSIVTGQAVAEAVEDAVKKVQQTDSEPAALIAAAQAANAAAKAAKEGGGVATAVAESSAQHVADDILKPVSAQDAHSMKNAADSLKHDPDLPPTPEQVADDVAHVKKMYKEHTGKSMEEIRDLNITNPENQLVEWSIGSRMASFWNDKFSWGSTRQMIAGNKSFLQQHSLKITKQLNTIGKIYTPTEIRDAFNALQPGAEPLTDAKTIMASKALRQVMENLVGSTRLLDDIEVAAKGIAVHRSRVVYEEINKYLGKDMDGFKFGKKVKDPITGKEIEIESGWHAWQYAILEKVGKGMDPLEFMYRIDNALTRGMLEKTFWEDMAATFGSSVPKAGHVQIKGANRLSGVYMPKELAAQMPKIDSFLKDIQAPLWGSESKFMRTIDEAQSGWKKLVTIAKPSNHSRDFVGSTILAALGGMRITNVDNWVKGRQILRYKRKMFNDIDPETGMIPGESTIKGGADPFIKSKDGTSFSMDQIYGHMHRKGLFPSATVLENIPESVTDAKSLLDSIPKRIRQPLGGKYMGGMGKLKETEEYLIRTAHFIDVVKRTKGKDVEEILEKATREVKKWHPDGSDLTQIERSVFRRVLPFYAWNRKSLPLIAEAAFRRPGKAMIFPKAIYNAQIALGVDAPSMSDPWPEDQLFPNWLSDKVGVGPFGEASEYSTFAENLDPFTTAGNEIQNPWSYGFGLLTPMVKAPLELGAGVNIGIGTPHMDRSRYIDEQIPILTDINRITNKNLGAGTVEHLFGERNYGEPSPIQGKYADEGTNWNALLNLMTASGLKSASRQNYIEQALRE